jgi:hypothetical protein
MKLLTSLIMARNTDGVQKSTKKKVTGTSTNRATRHVALTKERKRRLIRRISSVESEPRMSRDDQLMSRAGPIHRDQEAPIFYQPSDSRQLPSHPDRPNDSREASEREDEDEDEGTLANLQKLPEDERNRLIGKLFVLKIFPWPSPSWWILNAGGTRNRSQTDQTGNSDPKKEKFVAFLGIEMCMLTEEWIQPHFRQEVFSFQPSAQR